jgi:hypothetical protein
MIKTTNQYHLFTEVYISIISMDGFFLGKSSPEAHGKIYQTVYGVFEVTCGYSSDPKIVKSSTRI